jgi:hypothetical protein
MLDTLILFALIDAICVFIALGGWLAYKIIQGVELIKSIWRSL